MNNTFYIAKSPNDIQHYGVLGMKWGVRRYQDKNGNLTIAGKQHYGSSASRKYDKLTSKAKAVNAYRTAAVDKMEDGRDRMIDKYDRKIAKAMLKGKTQKVNKYKAQKADRTERSNRNIRDIKAGYDYYQKVITDYRDAKISKLDNALIKKDPQYKLAVKAYINQKISDWNWGAPSKKYGSFTTMLYGADIQNKTYHYRVDPTKYGQR